MKEVLERFSKKHCKKEIFYNLCFCLMAPQTTFSKNIKVIEVLKKRDFYNENISRIELEKIVKPTRFFRNKAGYLLEMKENFSSILDILYQEQDSKILRNSLVEKIKGMGMKAASHFLRNMGYRDLAIIDVHILRYMGVNPKEFTSKKSDYIYLEDRFIKIAEEKNISVAELDAIIWADYSGTEMKDFVY
ncbi:MAG: hypothetical protein ACOCV1_02580 [Bacillota bacterium]